MRSVSRRGGANGNSPATGTGANATGSSNVSSPKLTKHDMRRWSNSSARWAFPVRSPTRTWAPRRSFRPCGGFTIMWTTTGIPAIPVSPSVRGSFRRCSPRTPPSASVRCRGGWKSAGCSASRSPSPNSTMRSRTVSGPRDRH
ncbi:hypothetical protein SDC9_197675 [bioreactor metagenome]|uniref:Uncharacterized protein n=1 Tax=bioreactor metagenome TaxID=1076179 RepID=A0A645IHU5_9ZZZZ